MNNNFFKKKSLVVLNECMFTVVQKGQLKKSFTNVSFYTDTDNEDEAIKRVGKSNIVVMDQFMWTFSEKFLKACKNLELIIVNTTAYDRISVELLKKYNIKLSNLKTYASKDVAEVAVSMMMYLNCNFDIARGIAGKRKFESGEYKQSDIVRDIEPGHPIIPFLKRHPITEQTAGIIGLGNIGKEIVRFCQKLGMKTIAFNRSQKNVSGVKLVTLETIFRNSDVIFISLKYNPATMDKFISADLLKLAKTAAVLISIAPSELLDIDYLINNPNKFRGLGFDYFVTDKIVKLMNAKKNNIIVTPHLGHQSYFAYANLTNSIIDAAINFSKNNPFNLVEL